MSLFCFCQCVQVWVHIFWPFNLHFHLQQIFSYFSIYFHSLGLSSFSVHCKRYFDAFFLKFTFRGVGFFTFTFRGLAFSLSLSEGLAACWRSLWCDSGIVTSLTCRGWLCQLQKIWTMSIILSGKGAVEEAQCNAMIFYQTGGC